MAKTPKDAIAADWRRKRRQLAILMIDALEQDNRTKPDPDTPTVEAVHGAVCMAAILCRHGVQVDLMTADRSGGISFEKWSERKQWRVSADGSCDMLVPEGPVMRRVSVGGALP